MKPFRIIAALLLCLSLSTPVWAEETGQSPAEALDYYFPADIDGHWAEDELYDMVYADIVKGYSDQYGIITIKPNSQITRAEFAALLVRALNLQPGEQAKSFVDVKPNQWFYKEVSTAASLGIVSGMTANTFEPNAKIQRDQIASMLVRAFDKTVSFEGTPKAFKDVKEYWGKPYIDKASAAGMINGKTATEFKPADRATRAEALKMLYNGLHLEQSNPASDEELSSVFMNSEKEMAEAINQGNFNKAYELNKQYYTGFDKALGDFSVGMLKEIANEGDKVQITLNGGIKVEVTGKWDRFAKLYVSGGTYEVSVAGETSKEKMEGPVFLKKDKEEKWRIYYSDTGSVADSLAK
jgi:hypothetical protein